MRLAATRGLGAYAANIARFANENDSGGWRAMREALQIHPHRRLRLSLTDSIPIITKDPSLVYPLTREKYQVDTQICYPYTRHSSTHLFQFD